MAWDNDTLDNSSLVYYWDFGDGTTLTTDSEPVTHQWTDSGTVRTVTVTVDALFVDDLAISHNLTRTFTVHAYTYALNLVKGWNLVTEPPTGYAYRSNNLGLINGDTVASFDPATRTYKSYIVGTPFGVFDILPSTGYWIYVAANETLLLHGTLPSTTQRKSTTVPTGGGWAILGFNTLKTTRAYVHDGTGVLTLETWRALGTGEIANPSRFYVLFDHIIPANNSTTADLQHELRKFAINAGLCFSDSGCRISHS